MDNIFRKKLSEKGQSLNELALIMTFLLVLFSATVDLGWTFFTYVELQDAAQEGATFAAICPDVAQVRNHVRSSAAQPIDLQTALSDSQITVDFPDGIQFNRNVQVSVTLNHDIMVPFLGTLIGSQSYPITANATTTLLRVQCP